MLDANSLTFRQQYPNGAIVRDRLGRQLRYVVACNPETGEVVTCEMGWIAMAWHKVLWPRDPSGLHRFRFAQGRFHVRGSEILRRHGFYPAPLTIEPCQKPHFEFDRSLSVLDDRTLEEICGYGNDGLCSH